MSAPTPYYEDDFVTLYHGDALKLADVWTCGDVMSDDFPRFNVMPKRPLSVEDTGKNNEWWSGRLGYLPKDHWHEVSDPIEWDGEDSTEQRIRDLLMETRFDAGSDRGEGDPPDDAPLCIWAGDESHEPVDVLTPGDSITVFGRWPFVIRAAEVTS